MSDIETKTWAYRQIKAEIEYVLEAMLESAQELETLTKRYASLLAREKEQEKEKS